MSKTYSYQKWNIDFLFFSIGKPKVYSPILCFFRFMFHFTCMCKPAVLPQMISLFWWSLYSACFDLSTLVSSLPFLKSLFASCRSFLPCSTHTCTPFSNTIMNKMERLKSKNLYNVTTDRWKLVKKSRMKWKKMSCAVTYKGEGMVEAGIGSEKFLRIRILEILKETPVFGPSS